MPDHEIPKTIHFIWAGGSQPLQAKAIARIKAWHEQNPSFAIKLWVTKDEMLKVLQADGNFLRD